MRVCGKGGWMDEWMEGIIHSYKYYSMWETGPVSSFHKLGNEGPEVGMATPRSHRE